MKKISTAQVITRKEIEEAMNDFFQRGGKITTLPPQVFAENIMIGGDRFIIYERPDAFSPPS